MAQFKTVVKQYERMCRYYEDECKGCPFEKLSNCDITRWKDLDLAARLVMHWALAHPEHPEDNEGKGLKLTWPSFQTKEQAIELLDDLNQMIELNGRVLLSEYIRLILSKYAKINPTYLGYTNLDGVKILEDEDGFWYPELPLPSKLIFDNEGNGEWINEEEVHNADI